jgi:hypothetical protein
VSTSIAARPSNRGFWLVVGPMAAASVLLLVLIFANRPAAERASEFTARHNLRTSLSAARAIERTTGTFSAADAMAMRVQASDLAFTDPDLSSNNPDVISVFASDGIWAAASRADTGACFWIRTDPSGDVQTGRGSDCTGQAASIEAPAAWPSP